MNHPVIVSPEAENDLKEAFSWYENIRTGLGHDFLLQVDAGINFIKRNPEIYPIEYKETRKHIIKRFPNKIIYLFKDEKIIILAALHGKRGAELLKNRMNGFQ
ncbi:MAG: type II toxin-antitoxin system RelE/ParE family toxin [Methylobacter sp.]